MLPDVGRQPLRNTSMRARQSPPWCSCGQGMHCFCSSQSQPKSQLHTSLVHLRLPGPAQSSLCLNHKARMRRLRMAASSRPAAKHFPAMQQLQARAMHCSKAAQPSSLFDDIQTSCASGSWCELALQTKSLAVMMSVICYLTGLVRAADGTFSGRALCRRKEA